MLNRLIQFGLATILTTALAGYGVANAQEEMPEDETSAEGAAEGDAAAEAPAEGEGGEAAAEGEGAAEGDAAATTEEAAGAAPKHGMKKGGISVDVSVEINMSKEAVAKPFSVAPDIWYGVSDKLAAGLVHSGFARTGFWDAIGSSLCLAGEENGCAKVYDALQVLGKFVLSESGAISMVGVGGVYVNSFDPMQLGLRAGVDIGWHSGKIALHALPSITIGLTERDFNKEQLFLPVSVMYKLSAQLGLGVQTGIRGPLDGFGDTFQVPVSLGAMYTINESLSAGGAFGFPLIAGGTLFEDVTGVDARVLNLYVSWSK